MEENEHKLKQTLPVVTSALNEWSLRVNERKTEFVKVYIAFLELWD
jgi:hypothetical protein